MTKPEKIRQVGFWIPEKNVTWGAVYPITDPSRSVVYSLDFARGIDVIRIDRGKTSATVTPPLDESCERPDVGGARPPTGKGPPRAKCPTGKAKKKLARLSVRVSDGRRRARPGETLRYRIRVRNRSNTTARNVKLKVRLPRALRHLRGGRRKRGSRTVTYKLRPIRKGKVRQVRLRARVRPGTRVVKVVVSARATATHASSPSSAKGSNRTFVARARATRSPSPLAARTSAMSTRAGPGRRLASRSRRSRRSTACAGASSPSSEAQRRPDRRGRGGALRPRPPRPPRRPLSAPRSVTARRSCRCATAAPAPGCAPPWPRAGSGPSR